MYQTVVDALLLTC